MPIGVLTTDFDDSFLRDGLAVSDVGERFERTRRQQWSVNEFFDQRRKLGFNLQHVAFVFERQNLHGAVAWLYTAP